MSARDVTAGSVLELRERMDESTMDDRWCAKSVCEEAIDALEASRAEVAALRRKLEEHRIIVPPISPEEWEDLQRRHRSPIGAIRHEEILHEWIVRHVSAIGSDEIVVKRADWEARAPSPDVVAVLQRFVDWCEKYPSSRIYDHCEITTIARIMDEIHEDAKRALRSGDAEKGVG